MGAMSETPKPDGATVERFRAVVLPHLDAAYGFARWLTRDPVAAQDVAQEAMLRALRYFHAFRGGEAKPCRRWFGVARSALMKGGRVSRKRHERRVSMRTAADRLWPGTVSSRGSP